jgi:hypothetical protein
VFVPDAAYALQTTMETLPNVEAGLEDLAAEANAAMKEGVEAERAAEGQGPQGIDGMVDGYVESLVKKKYKRWRNQVRRSS